MQEDGNLESKADGFRQFIAERLQGTLKPGEVEFPAHTFSAERMWRDGAASASDIAEAMSDYYDLPRGVVEHIANCPPLIGDLSRRYFRDVHAYAYKDSGVATIAIADPSQSEVINAIRLALGSPAELVIVSFEEILLLFERALDEAAPRFAADTEDASETDTLRDTVQSMQDFARGAPIVRLIDDILERATGLGATDIHLETERDHLRVRLRVDGQLRNDQRLPLAMAPAIISRIKILAGLDIADRRLPQDGRANVRIGSSEADIRVAVMPTMYGETAVLRLLMRDTRLLELNRVGMSDNDQTTFRELLAEPHGIVVITGPTGSGKTTTLATAMSILNDPRRKIVTVEDPIEYQIAGIHQTQIKPSIGLTFASALRSFLRHDPDVIMIGEMRDRETAGIGIQAALTGHLVMTTLHTNSASDALVRLTDMGVEPYLLGSALRGVLGQRLVRRLCERCRIPDTASAQSLEDLSVRRSIHLPRGAIYYRALGCEACGQTGYRGRIGIFEVLRVDDQIRQVIRHGSDPHIVEKHARDQGMTLMLEDGIAKSARGLTSIEEVLRVIG